MQYTCTHIQSALSLTRTCMNTCMHAHAYIRAHKNEHKNRETHTHIPNTYIQTDRHKYIQTYRHTLIQTYIYEYVHIHTYMHACIHAYTHTNTHTYSLEWRPWEMRRSVLISVMTCACAYGCHHTNVPVLTQISIRMCVYLHISYTNIFVHVQIMIRMYMHIRLPSYECICTYA